MNRTIRRAAAIAAMTIVSTVAASRPAHADGVEDVDAAWKKAILAGDAAALAGLYAPDAVLFPPDADEVKGEGIRAYYDGMVGALKVTEVTYLEESGITRGSMSAGWGKVRLAGTTKADGKPFTMVVRFAAVAEKEKKDGRWRFVADHASNVPAAPAAAAPAKQ